MDWRWKEVDTLESRERWNEAKSLLIKNWRQKPNDLKVIIRLGFFCWYVLVEEGPLGIKDVDFDELENVLNEVTHFGMANYMTNEDFLWCFGYMISLFPYYFGEYEYWEEKGISMLKLAYELCPDEPVYRYSYLGTFLNTEGKLKDEFYQVHAVLEDRFQGEGVLSEYFKSMWHSCRVN
ncbi:hypothetical protein [Metabacillus litoralis]|uniref:hypothetical protein n=1 Tax=Metabacillus litoralis TaxID=152268 RepID=UPI001CFC6B5A|nr:hypothetical protein [Metabacillus litoralis]